MRKGFHGKCEIAKRCRSVVVLWTFFCSHVCDPSCCLSEDMRSISKLLRTFEVYDRNAVNLDCPSIVRVVRNYRRRFVDFGCSDVERRSKQSTVGFD